MATASRAVWSAWLLAELDPRQGQAAQARVRLLPLVSRATGPDANEGVGQLLAFILPSLAWANLQLHEFDEAERVVTWARSYAEEEALALARPMPYPYAEGRLLHAQGLLPARQGDYVTAWNHLGAALTIFRRPGAGKDV